MTLEEKFNHKFLATKAVKLEKLNFCPTIQLNADHWWITLIKLPHQPGFHLLVHGGVVGKIVGGRVTLSWKALWGGCLNFRNGVLLTC